MQAVQKVIVSLSILGAFALTPESAHAQSAASKETITKVVQVRRFNLNSQEGRRRLDRQLAIAAWEVCGSASDVDIAGKNDVRRCRSEVLAKARQSVSGALAYNAR